MSCHYKHLTIEERESIALLQAKGKNKSQIAKALNRDRSTISRELERNTNKDGNYSPSSATQQYKKRRKKCGRVAILEKNKALAQRIRSFIEEQQWSPEQISKRFRKEGKKIVSYTTIYRAIKRGRLNIPGERKSKGKYPMEKKLRRKGKKKSKIETRGHMKISNPIENRPLSATNRSWYGHWEIDTVCGKKSKSCIVTLTDRRSRFLIAGKCEKQQADCIKKVVVNLLEQYKQTNKLRSITADRGKEFSYHEWMSSQLANVPFYFANPGRPWERGTNENTNGLIREYIPKRTDIDIFSDQEITRFVEKINFRPRKCLKWKSAFEMFFGTVLHLT